MFRLLDLFSGIGGFSLGLERSGFFRTVAFCEIEPFPRAVLRKHWPEIPCHEDITTREFIEGEADAICGGFPCQDVSLAGKRAGLSGSRSGLYRELVRAVRLVRPRVAIVENVAALRSNGMGTVLGDLAEIGYDTEWHCIPASAVGAPHERDRIWIVAHARGEQHEGYSAPLSGTLASELSQAHSHANGNDEHRRPSDVQVGRIGGSCAPEGDIYPGGDQWASEPAVGRVAYGVPDRSHRLKGLGNAVVPQIPEIIGRAIGTSTVMLAKQQLAAE